MKTDFYCFSSIHLFLSLSLSVSRTVVSQFYESQVYDEYVIKVLSIMWNKRFEQNLILILFEKKTA